MSPTVQIIGEETPDCCVCLGQDIHHDRGQAQTLVARLCMNPSIDASIEMLKCLWLIEGLRKDLIDGRECPQEMCIDDRVELCMLTRNEFVRMVSAVVHHDQGKALRWKTFQGPCKMTMKGVLIKSESCMIFHPEGEGGPDLLRWHRVGGWQKQGGRGPLGYLGGIECVRDFPVKRGCG